MVRFCRQYRYYLLGKPFTIRTDHSSLRWFLRFKGCSYCVRADSQGAELGGLSYAVAVMENVKSNDSSQQASAGSIKRTC